MIFEQLCLACLMHFYLLKSLKKLHHGQFLLKNKFLKELCHRLCILKKKKKRLNFSKTSFQSVSIFAILSHPCSFLLQNHPFGVFSFLANHYFYILQHFTCNCNLGYQRDDSKYCDIAPLKANQQFCASQEKATCHVRALYKSKAYNNIVSCSEQFITTERNIHSQYKLKWFIFPQLSNQVFFTFQNCLQALQGQQNITPFCSALFTCRKFFICILLNIETYN